MLSPAVVIPMHRVAPLAGAWIETIGKVPTGPQCPTSHPSRVRGLKRVSGHNREKGMRSHPSRVRGLKQE